MDHDFTEFNTALRPYFVILAAIFGTVFIGSALFTGAFDARWLGWAIAMAALGVSIISRMSIRSWRSASQGPTKQSMPWLVGAARSREDDLLRGY